MSESLQRFFLGVIALGVSCLAIEVMPISRQAAYWNRCLDKTVSWINDKSDFKEWDRKAKDSLAVRVCNGTDYEPEFKVK